LSSRREARREMKRKREREMHSVNGLYDLVLRA